MGLSFRIVGVVGLLATAVLVPLVRDRKPEQPLDPRTARLEALELRRTELLNRWSARSERDSLLGRLAILERADTGIQVWLRGFSAGTGIGWLVRHATRLVRQVGSVDSNVRVGVLYYNAAEYGTRSTWATYSGAWIGRAGGKTWCVAIVAATLSKHNAVSGYLDTALAPCLLYAAFGRPGPSVAAWLGAMRYASIQGNNWLVRPKGWRDGYEQPPWMSLYDPSWFEAMVLARSSRLWELGLGDLSTTLAPPYQLGTLALRCLEGNLDFCRRAVLEAPVGALESDWPTDLTISRNSLFRRRGLVLGPRPVSGWFVSDLIREHGRERFGRFWRSAEPIEAAFTGAFSEPVGEWTERWARMQWEDSNERFFGSRVIMLGATLAPSWPLIVAAWTFFALGLTVAAAKRRQVS